jgi:hypothetical protein
MFPVIYHDTFYVLLSDMLKIYKDYEKKKKREKKIEANN